jgi:hypothetical protein
MTDLRARIEAARKAGYSDADIQARLADVPEIKRAREAGYDDAAIYSRLGLKTEPQATGEVAFLERPTIPGTNVGVIPKGGFGETTTGKTLGYLGDVVSNIPESAIGMGAKGYDIAEGLIGLTTEEGRAKAAQAIQGIPQAVHRDIMGAVVSPLEAAAKVKESFRTDPLGTMAGVSALTGGVGALLRPGNMMARISQVTNPLAIPEMAARGITGGYESFVSPIVSQTGAERAAGAKLFESAMDPMAAAQAMRQEPRSIIGQVPASQRLAEARQFEPGLATLEADLATGETPIGREAILTQQRRLSALQQQLHAIDQDILQRGQAMSPQEAASASRIRNDITQSIAAAEQRIQGGLSQTGARIPATNPLTSGEAVAARTRQIRDTFREERISPAYEAAFQSAGNQRIPVDNVIADAERIIGARLADVPLGVANRTVADLRELQNGATLRQLDRVRKSVNKDIAAAQSAGRPLGDLMDLHNSIDEAVRASDLPMRAQLQYSNALNLYRSEFVPRFKTGVVSDILRTTKKNQSGILSSQTVSRFMANEDAAAQFATTFENDAVARRAMEAGIQDMARVKTVDPITHAVDPDKITAFIADNQSKFDLMGIDAERLLDPVRREAQTLLEGRRELERDASFFRTDRGEALRTGTDYANALLKSPAAMDVGLKRLSPAGRAALTKEITDRAIREINTRSPDKALDYLDKHKGTIRMVLDKSDFDRLQNLAKNQQALLDVEKRAVKPTVQLDVDLSNVPPDVMTDFNMVARELQRIKSAEEMTGLRPAQKIGEIGTENIKAAKELKPNFIDSRLSVMEKIFDFAGKYINRKTTAVLADALIRNPEKAADLIEREIARRAKIATPAPETRRKTLGRAMLTGGLAAQDNMIPENRNAMAR